MADRTEEQALLSWKQQMQAEREAAAAAYEEADKKNRESEKQAFKDIGNFVLDTLTPVGDIRAIYDWLQGDKNARTTLAAVLGVVGIKGAKGGSDEVADELIRVVREQAEDAKGWARMGGSKPSTEVKQAYNEFGLDIDKSPKSKLKEGELQGVRPAPIRERNQTQFPAGNDRTRLYNDEFEQLSVGPKHTQGQADPNATAGLMPQAPASEGSRMDNAVNFANRRAKQWDSGWDAQAMREQVEKVTKTATREAAKGKAGGKPEFWIYDESADELIKVKRNAKTDALEIKRVKPKEDEAIELTNEAILWDRKTDKPVLDANGKPQFSDVPVYNDKIDIVVPREGKKELDKMLYDLAIDMLDKK